MLIDADMRKPSVHRSFELSLQPGLSNYLTGNASLDQIIRPTPVPNLFVVPAGNPPPNPALLLSSKISKDLILRLCQDFHHVIIDTPPVVEFAEARIVASMVEGVLLVLRNHHTTRRSGELARQLLSQANVRIIGGILNMATANRLGYGGYYYGYYKYYSKYYKDYDSVPKITSDS